MEELRLSAVATRVVAWHNRHPLARRISASQVHAIGYVALPFSDPAGSAVAPPAEAAPDEPAGGSLRQRAEARARQQDAAAPAGGVPVITQLAVDPKQLTADFSEDFIDPLSPREVARFARRRGQALVRAPSDGPVRRIRADGRGDGGGLTLYLLTAVIETGTWKSRVLLGAGDKPAVLGRRVLAPARAAALLVPLLAAGGWLYQKGHKAPVAVGVPVAQAASAAAVPAAALPLPASAAADAHAHEADAHAHEANAHGAQAAASAPLWTASAPLDVEPRLGRIEMPSIRPQLGAARAASAAAEAPLTAHAPAAVPAAASGVAVAAAPAVPPPKVPQPDRPPARPPMPAPAQAAVADEPAFALSTRPLRTRAEADQVRVAMKSLLRATTSTPVRVDIMAEGDDWRVVGLPFATQAEADKARALLLSRGMKVVVVGF